MKISEGKIISIFGKKYDVLKGVKECDDFNRDTGELIGEHIEIKLHKHGDSSLHPTHILKLYQDGSDKMVFLEIFQPKVNLPVGRMGDIFSYRNEKTISPKDLKVFS